MIIDSDGTRRAGAFAVSAFALLALAAAARAESPVARGAYLTNAVAACGNCHTPKGPAGDIPGMDLAGFAKFDVRPGMAASAPNITPDKETGIGAWTDAQIAAAIRDGVRPDGTIVGPPMPFRQYRHLSDEDVGAIVAYLRTVKPVRNPVPKSEYEFPLPPSYGPPAKNVTAPPRADRVAYGAYLAGPVAHCVECHSPMGPAGPDVATNLGAGGFEFYGPWGTSVATNITPTGLAGASDAEVKTMITKGIRPDGSRMLPPMGYAYYAGIAAGDLDAIVAYLRSLPPK